MTHEEAIEQIQARLAAFAKFTADVTMDIRRELDALKQPQEAKMSLAEAIQRATKIYDDAASKGNVDFYYDRQSKKTTRVVRTRSNGLVKHSVGRSWCSKDDDFIYAVGQAIAYYRAIGHEVPDWLLHIPQN